MTNTMQDAQNVYGFFFYLLSRVAAARGFFRSIKSCSWLYCDCMTTLGVRHTVGA